MYDLQNMIRVRTEPVDEKNSGRLEQPGGGASSSGGLTSTCFVFFFFFFFSEYCLSKPALGEHLESR
jgi:hypothetical protein